MGMPSSAIVLDASISPMQYNRGALQESRRELH